MNTLPHSERTSGNSSDLVSAIRWVWDVIRYPLASILVLLEPLVTGILSTLALLGAFAAVMFQLGLPTGATDVAFLWKGALECVLAIFIYFGLIALLQRD